jgi:hypothetical protein
VASTVCKSLAAGQQQNENEDTLVRHKKRAALLENLQRYRSMHEAWGLLRTSTRATLNLLLSRILSRRILLLLLLCFLLLVLLFFLVLHLLFLPRPLLLLLRLLPRASG